MESLIALAQLGGFATLGIVMTLAVRILFAAWRNGDLVAKTVWDATEARADKTSGQLERNTEALGLVHRDLARLAAASERQAKALEKLADGPAGISR